MSDSQRVAIITGASQGIGASLVSAYRKLGYAVVANSRTITESDNTWFTLITMNQHPLHSDAHYAQTHTQHKQRVVLGPLVYSVVIGMTVADISGRAIANLEVNELKHEKPTFIGDTLYAKSRVLALRESRQGDRGIVTVATQGVNQRGETVCSYTRAVLVPRKNHATLGEGRLPS